MSSPAAMSSVYSIARDLFAGQHRLVLSMITATNPQTPGLFSFAFIPARFTFTTMNTTLHCFF